MVTIAKIAAALMRGILNCHGEPSWVGQEAEKLRVGGVLVTFFVNVTKYLGEATYRRSRLFRLTVGI